MRIVRDWAGKDRAFALSFGDVLNLEQACGEGIGVIAGRIRTGMFRAQDVAKTILHALTGGGMPLVEAKRLVEEQIDARPYTEHLMLATEILAALMFGVEPDDTPRDGDGAGDPAGPIRFSEISQICRTFHLSPVDLRAMSYADLTNMLRGFNAKGGRKAEVMSEEEYEAIMAAYHEPVQEAMQ